MANLTTFWISAVKFAHTGGHNYISHVLLHTSDETTLGNGVVKSKDDVLRLLDNQQPIKTMRWNYTSASWIGGAKVEPYQHAGVRYLRTSPDSSVSDNLHNMLLLDTLRG